MLFVHLAFDGAPAVLALPAVTAPKMNPTAPSEEIDAAIARLGAEPRETERAELEGQRWLANTGPSVSTYRLWYLSDRQFRINEDIPNAEWSPEIDAVVNGDEGWVYASDGSVSVMNFDRPPPGRNPRIHVQKIRGVVQELLYAPGDQVTEGAELLKLVAVDKA